MWPSFLCEIIEVKFLRIVHVWFLRRDAILTHAILKRAQCCNKNCNLFRFDAVVSQQRKILSQRCLEETSRKSGSQVKYDLRWILFQHTVPERDNAHSRAVRRVLERINMGRARRMKLFVIRQQDALEAWMKRFLVEDRSSNMPSYVDYLCNIHREIRSLLT